MNFLSKLSLYDILAMIVPGFIILLWGLSMFKLSWMPNTFEVDKFYNLGNLAYCCLPYRHYKPCTNITNME